MQAEGVHKLQEALQPIHKNTQLHYTNESKSNESNTLSQSFEHEKNLFKEDLIITKQEAPTIYRFHPLTQQSCKNISPLMHIPELEPDCTKKFSVIGEKKYQR